jgi:PAS domain S-box-containing protein
MEPRRDENLQTIIIILAAVSFILAELVIYFVAGQVNLIISNLFYIPVIILSFRYPRKGVIVGVILGICYLLLITYLTYPVVTELIPSVMQFYVFIIISIIISSVSSRNRMSEAKYWHIFNESGNAMCLLDTKTRKIIEMNTQFHHLFCIPEVPYQEIDIGTIVTDRTTWETILSEITENDRVTHELSVIQCDGKPLTVLVSVTPLASSNIILLNFTDITKSEKALKFSENKYRTLVETSLEGIWAVDKRGITTYVNPKMPEMLGYSGPEMLGRSMYDFMDPGARDIAVQKIDVLKSGIKDYYELELRTKGGSLITTLMAISSISDPEGNFAGMLALVSDISSRKKYENDLKASLEEKSVLIMEIHHRVKNNLQIISGLIRLQSRYISNQQAVDALRQCETRVSTMALVHESLYQSGNLSNINAKRHITNLANMLLMSNELDIQIKLDIDVDDIPIDMNAAVPSSLIINELILNSIKYAFPGRDNGIIGISLHKENGDMLTLVVRDDGAGLPKDMDINVISSLGLKLVVRLVREQLKGTIDIEREKGTKFVIRFPYVIQDNSISGGGQDAG